MGDLADKKEVCALRRYGHSVCLQWLCALIRARLNLDRQAETRHACVGFFFFFLVWQKFYYSAKGQRKLLTETSEADGECPLASLWQGNVILFKLVLTIHQKNVSSL